MSLKDLQYIKTHHTSFNLSCALEEVPRTVFARPAKAFDGPAPSVVVQASLPVTISRRDMLLALLNQALARLYQFGHK